MHVMGSGETATAGIKDEKQILPENASLIPRLLSPYLRELLAMPDFKYFQNLFSLLLRVSFKSGSYINNTESSTKNTIFPLVLLRLSTQGQQQQIFDKGYYPVLPP
jgi:hypothetical protein